MTVFPKVSQLAADPVSVFKTIGRAALYGVRLALFFLFFWARFVIVPLCNALSMVLFLALLFSLWAFPDKTQMLWAFGLCGFVAFVIAWAYDFVLALLSPQEMLVIR